MEIGRSVAAVVGICTLSGLGLMLLAAAAPAEVGYRINEPPSQAQTQSPPSLMSKSAQVEVGSLALSATARVSARTCAGFVLGSGFVVDGQLLTNRHMVEGADEVKVELGEQTILSSVSRSGPDLDLALVVDESLGQALLLDQTWVELRFASANPDVGEPLLFAGHAGGGQTELVVGRVHGYSPGEPYGVSGRVLLIDELTQGGFSGGPVLNSEGEVIAILQGFDRVTELTLAIPVETMAKWIATPNRSQTTGSGVDAQPGVGDSKC